MIHLNRDPKLYRDWTIKEVVKNMQELLLTGGIHTNIFKVDDYKISVVVNDRETLRWVIEFFMESGFALYVSYDNKTLSLKQYETIKRKSNE